MPGPAGSGKSVALNRLAQHEGAPVIYADTLMQALPMLMSKATALNVRTFIDEVTAADLVKIEQLAKLYPVHYVTYVAGEGI